MGNDLIRRSGTSGPGATLQENRFYSNTTLVGTYPQVREYLLSSFTGYNVPNYHRLVREGKLIPQTPWHQVAIRGKTQGSYDITIHPSGSTYWHYSTVPDWFEYTDWLVTEAELEALAPVTYSQYVTDAAAKIYGNGYDALTSLAELTEVRTMFMGVGRKLLSLLSKVRSGRMNTRIADLANTWMEGRYGWRTLLYDIVAINEVIESWNDDPRTRYSEKVGHTTSYETTEVKVIDKVDYKTESTTRSKIELSIRGSVVADIDVPKLQFNPLQTAWEKVPLSFVVDWVLTVGKSLNALSFLSKQTQYAASAGFRLKVERSFSNEIVWKGPKFYAGDRQQTGTCTASLEYRRPCSIPLIPHLAFNVNGLKVLDLMSLIVQRLPRR